MLSWLIPITHYTKGEKTAQRSIFRIPVNSSSSSEVPPPSLLKQTGKKSKALGLTHCPDSRLCFCKAAYGFSSRRCRVCHKYFSQGMLSKTKHWKSSVGFFFCWWELIESYRSHSMWEKKELIEPRTNERSDRLSDLKHSVLHSLFISALVKLCCCWMGSRSALFIS